MRRWMCKRNNVLLLLLLLLFLIIIYSSNFNFLGIWFKDDNDKQISRMKLFHDEVPVVIVDQHQEVIPYWYKAVEEGILKSSGNTLIHIDAHSDMATPEDYDSLVSFNYKITSRQSVFLPLMESNDVFIQSAIFTGLIDKVVWVKPDWLNGSYDAYLLNGYVGVTKINISQENTVCSCQQVPPSKPFSDDYECFYINRDVKNIEDMDAKINPSECKSLKKFRYVVLGENDFEHLLKLKKVRSVIIDVDEDYFGVKSGVGSFIELGISEETQTELNTILRYLFCPKSVESEQNLDEELRSFLEHVANAKKSNMQVTDDMGPLQEELSKFSRQYFCKTLLSKTMLLEQLLSLVGSLSQEETDALSNLRFCLQNSPRLNQKSNFGVCHGTIFPADTLNQIYVSKMEEIVKRGERLKDILTFVSNFTDLKFVTIARSLRDGYTPRHQQQIIERTVIQSLRNVLTRIGKVPRIIYDDQLVFGDRGWQ